MRFASGFTLTELSLTIAVAATLGLLALPGLQDLLAGSRQASRTMAFVVSANLARSEALRRAHPVTLCPSPDGARCARDFSAGWIVFEDLDEDGDVGGAEVVLDAYAAVGTGPARSTRTRYVWRAYGRRSTNGSVTFCDPKDRSRSRAVIISYTGRPRASDRSSGGASLRC